MQLSCHFLTSGAKMLFRFHIHYFLFSQNRTNLEKKKEKPITSFSSAYFLSFNINCLINYNILFLIFKFFIFWLNKIKNYVISSSKSFAVVIPAGLPLAPSIIMSNKSCFFFCSFNILSSIVPEHTSFIISTFFS